MHYRNLHTHTWRCKHANGDFDKYCQSAIDNGIKILGFSDHAPQHDGKWPATHMTKKDLAEYCFSFQQAKIKYKDKLKLYLGLECEYRPDSIHLFKDMISEYHFDYLAAGPHWYPDPIKKSWPCAFYEIRNVRDLILYTEYVIDGISSELFDFYTHPDAFAYSYHKWDSNTKSCCIDIIQASIEHNVALEINGLGLQKPKINTPDGPRHPYPYYKFWEVAAEYPDCRVICNSDAHDPDDIYKGIKEAIKIANHYNLKQTDLLLE